MANETLNVILKLITGNYQREARQAAAATSQIGTAAANTSTHATGMANSMAALSATVKAAAVAFVAFKAVDFLGDSVSAASDLEESINAVNKVFGTASGTIENFGQVTANAVGLSTREFNELATVTGSMLSNFGFNAQQAAAETIKLTQRAADMGSVFNTDVNDVLVAVNAALRGESEPIRKFGVSLDDAAVRAKAVELGLAATSGEVDSHGKAVARLAIIYEQTSKTQGDFAATSDDLANAQRRATAAMENAQARLGKAVTPALANLTDRFAEGIERIAAAFGDEAARKSIIFQEAMKGLNDEMAAGLLGTEDLANALLHLAVNSDLTASDFMTLAGVVGLTEDQWGIFADSLIAQAKEMGLAPEVIAELEAALRGAAGAAGAAVAPTADATAALINYGTAADRAARKGLAVASAQRAITQALLEAANPAFAAATAVGRLRDAQENLASVQADATSSAEDIAQAFIDLAAAKLEAQGALDSLDAGGISGAASAIARALEIPYEAALALLETLGLIDNMTVTATVITNFVNRGDAATGGGSGRTYPGGKQHGGPVWSGQPYVVGEAGPELFVPQQSGMIHPNSRISDWGGIAAFQHGGVIPGQRGEPVLAVVHAGETILPTHKPGVRLQSFADGGVVGVTGSPITIQSFANGGVVGIGGSPITLQSFADGGVVGGSSWSSQTMLNNQMMMPVMSMGGSNSVTINVESPMRDFRTDLQYATILASVTNLVETQS